MHFISNILANPTLVVKKEKDKKQNKMVNGETGILGTEDRDLPHEAGPTCPHLHDFCRGCHSTIPGQWGLHTKIDNGWILNFFFFLKQKGETI